MKITKSLPSSGKEVPEMVTINITVLSLLSEPPPCNPASGTTLQPLNLAFGRPVLPHISGRSRFGSVSFGSEVIRFGLVQPEQISFPVRRGSACVFRTCRDSVQFGSFRFRIRILPVPELNGLVWFGSAGSVRFLTPS